MVEGSLRQSSGAERGGGGTEGGRAVVTGHVAAASRVAGRSAGDRCWDLVAWLSGVDGWWLVGGSRVMVVLVTVSC